MVSSEEAHVREAAQGCLDFWLKNSNSSKGAVCVHDACAVMSLLEDGPQSVKGSVFKVQPHDASYQVMAVKILPVGEENAASVHVSISSSSSSTQSSSTISGWLVMLRHRNIWTCISAAFSNKNNQDPILPEHFEAVNNLTWDGYCAANKACDAVGMAKVFHSTCRLTFASEEMNDVAVIDQPLFLKKVGQRYETEAMHQPYAKLKTHPDIGRNNTLQSIEFATSDLCMVTLKVGHPPCLWSDLLTCCNLGPEQGGWWIVHKSSCHEDFALTDEMKALVQPK